jgi:YVTN family beta-propeller protein
MSYAHAFLNPSSTRAYSERRALRRWIGAVVAMAFGLLMVANGWAQSSSLTTQVWPTGTLLAHFRDGGRITTYHRGHLYLGGLERTTVYNINNPTSPVRVNEWNVGENGHRWWKIGDLFWREYSQPEIQGSGSRFADLSQMPTITPWTRSAPLTTGNGCCADLSIFPHIYYPWDNHRIIDQRTGQEVGRFDFNGQKAINGILTLRIGNLLFYTTETPNGGISVFDVGNPASIRLLDVLQGDYFQYTTFYAVWRNYIVLAVGNNTNHGGNNVIAIDFSDSTNLTYRFGFPTEQATDGRYIFFQDEYGFVANGGRIAKINMDTGAATQLPITVPRPLHDFQVIPLGHLLVASGSEAGTDANTFIFTHQNGLDRNAPYVGYNLPADGATNLPVSTVVGLVINETLDDTTVNGSNIHIRPVTNGTATGEPLPVDVVSSQHNVINVAPRSPLLANTTYQVRVVGNGIRDAAGNGLREHISYFSTGSALAPGTGTGTPGPGSGGGSGSGTPPPPPGSGFSNVAPTITGLTVTPARAVEGSSISFATTAIHPDGVIEYRWRFGDGSPQTGWSTSAQIQHVYAGPGHYSVFVQARVRGNDGTFYVTGEARSFVVESTTAAPDRETRSSPIVVDRVARLVWNVNPDSDTVTLLNADSMSVVRHTTVGKRPVAVALDSAGRAWVACQDADQIQVIARDGQVVRTIALGRGVRPSAIVMSQNGLQAYVAEYAVGRVRGFNTQTFAETGAIDVGPTPKAMALTQNGNLYVTRFISRDAAGEIFRVNVGSQLTSSTSVQLAVDTATVDNGASARGLPNYVGGLALSPGGQQVWYVAKKDNILRGLRRDGQRRTHESVIRTLVGVVDTSTGTEQASRRRDIDDSSMPSSAVVSPVGAHVFVTLQGSNRLAALDVRSGEEVASADVGLAPQGVAVDPNTRRIFVHNFMGRSVSVVDGNALITQAVTTLPVLTTINTVTTELLAPAVLQGKRIFYNAADTRMSLESYISCASCHAEGGHDGRVWDASDGGEGLRSTISMRGRAGTRHGPVHWTGNFDEIQDFEIDIRGVFGGTGFTTGSQFDRNPLGARNGGRSPDLDALAAYVTSLSEIAPSPHRAADGALTAAGARGREIFQRNNCSSCHSGANFSDSGKGRLHNVGTLNDTSGSRLGGTLAGLDTPTLLGLWEKTRFLHDGRAATLVDMFTDTSARRHGRLNELTAAERLDLQAYLLQIDASEPAPPSRPESPTEVTVQ